MKQVYTCFWSMLPTGDLFLVTLLKQRNLLKSHKKKEENMKNRHFSQGQFFCRVFHNVTLNPAFPHSCLLKPFLSLPLKKESISSKIPPLLQTQVGTPAVENFNFLFQGTRRPLCMRSASTLTGVLVLSKFVFSSRILVLQGRVCRELQSSRQPGLACNRPQRSYCSEGKLNNGCGSSRKRKLACQHSVSV